MAEYYQSKLPPNMKFHIEEKSGKLQNKEYVKDFLNNICAKEIVA